MLAQGGAFVSLHLAMLAQSGAFVSLHLAMLAQGGAFVSRPSLAVPERGTQRRDEGQGDGREHGRRAAALTMLSA
ncbi:hypothetical protein [Microbacterium tumbae]